MDDRSEQPEEERQGRGRTAKKLVAQTFDVLAAQMVETGAGVCQRLPLPDALRAELDLARRITTHGALKRQIKRLAGLLRHDEETAAAVRSVLDGVNRQSRAERDHFHRLEELRDGLCDPERFAAALEQVASELPALDRPALTRLARSVHATANKRDAREIFRRLRAASEGA